MVVLSDGADTASQRDAGDGHRRSAPSPGSRPALVGLNRRPADGARCRQLAGDVGGRLIPASSAASLLSAFTAAAATFTSDVQVHGTLDEPLAPGSHFVAVTLVRRRGGTAVPPPR